MIGVSAPGSTCRGSVEIVKHLRGVRLQIAMTDPGGIHRLSSEPLAHDNRAARIEAPDRACGTMPGMPDETTTPPLSPPQQETTAETPKRVIGRPFPRGNNANPGGRPRKDARFTKLAKGYALEGLKLAASIARDKSEKTCDRLEAIRIVQERAYGRPVAAVANPDGTNLIPGASSADNPLSALLSRLTARKAAPPAPEGPGPTPAENAQPSASGSEPRGVPS